MRIVKRKNQTGLSLTEKAIAHKIVGQLNVTFADSVMEISLENNLSDGDVFANIGCYVKVVKDGDISDAGEFDYVFLFNISFDRLPLYASKAESHVCKGGKLIVLNTKNILTSAQIDGVVGNLSLEYFEPVITSDFSLIINRN